MNSQIPYDSNLHLIPISDTTKLATGMGLLHDLLASIPNAIAQPILAAIKTAKQAEIIEAQIAATSLERMRILETIQVLAKTGNLTPELGNALMAAFYSYPTFCA